MPTSILATVGAFDESTRSVEILASTPKPVDGEALATWDLERFLKNPVILWAHDTDELPIGRAEDVRIDEEGLKMRVILASAAVTPLAEQVWNGVKEGIVRAVSVGFEPGQASKNDGVTTRTASELLEVSFVPVPKDEDAGILSPEERARRASAAASELARHRAKRTDAADLRVDNIGHFDAAQMSKVEWTPWGTARIKARVSRVGVLDYPGRRELRPRDEVMRADSIASLKGVPVVDFVDHKDLVGPDDFRKKVRGFVEEAHADGDYIAATLHIHDGPTLDAIRNGERLDISAGYIAPVDANPGEWQGERYDVVQRDIVYNHVALCPPGRGRAGREVALKLDSQTSSHRQVATVMADQVRRVAR